MNAVEKAPACATPRSPPRGMETARRLARADARTRAACDVRDDEQASPSLSLSLRGYEASRHRAGARAGPYPASLRGEEADFVMDDVALSNEQRTTRTSNGRTGTENAHRIRLGRGLLWNA